MKELDYGKDYKYAHDHEENFADQEYLPEDISSEAFYKTGDNPSEDRIRESLNRKWKGKYGDY